MIYDAPAGVDRIKVGLKAGEEGTCQGWLLWRILTLAGYVRKFNRWNLSGEFS